MHNLSDPTHLPPARQIIALLGSRRELHPLVLQSLLAHLARGERLGVIVGDNHLDAYALARLARAHGIAPLDLLSRVELSRPFTCYQLQHCVSALVHSQHAKSRGHSERSEPCRRGAEKSLVDVNQRPPAKRGVTTPPPESDWSALYVLGLLDTFCDQDVRTEDALRLLQATLARLRALAESGLPVLVTLAPPPSESGRESFVEVALGAMDAYWKPSPAVLSEPVVRQSALF